ncbi:DUF1906 domain-containing protein [Streptomyces sp. HNM0574]|uniref:DUF1906 domain-containing protein n=1 Tax=Streptomyces sp. HNM0574 TaxID=2714954 RepID=UPI00146B9F9F|nr:DUF1906 domain-containing protein [Streptomyces sp. HNM0574]NLU69661.1 DUF1906 domain-containing protein [Streptomyces sp. HNM0574]
MRTNSQIVRRVTVPVVVVAALATLVTAGALPAAADTPPGTPEPGTAPGTSPDPAAAAPGPAADETPEGVRSAVEREIGEAVATDVTGSDTGQAAEPARTGGRAPQTGTVRDDPRNGARIFTGEAFDTCSAPSEQTMRTWRKTSPFGAVGVYFGGRGRGCAQPNLTPDWVRSVDGMGWKLLPLYVGSQSPCVRAEHKKKFRMSHQDPWAQGAREGQDAVQRAKEYGLGAKSPLYLDMEDYNHADSRCAATTLSFVKGWNTRVREAGYLPGFYSSAASGLAHMENARKGLHPALPEAVWFARWNGRADVNSEPVLASGSWSPHRRIHQYQGDVTRSYGGVRLNIDRNRVDAPVARLG